MMKLQRVATNKVKPTCLDINLPGHDISLEYDESFESYLLETDNNFAKNAEKKSQKESIDWFELAKQHKDKGNMYFRQDGKIHLSEKEYRRALYCLRRCNKNENTLNLRVILYVNLTACDLQQEDYSFARKHATKALKMDPTNTKALYRRSIARKYAAFDLNGAVEDLKLANEIAPNDLTLKKALENIQKEIIKAQNNEAAVAKRMFQSS